MPVSASKSQSGTQSVSQSAGGSETRKRRRRPDVADPAAACDQSTVKIKLAASWTTPRKVWKRESHRRSVGPSPPELCWSYSVDWGHERCTVRPSTMEIDPIDEEPAAATAIATQCSVLSVLTGLFRCVCMRGGGKASFFSCCGQAVAAELPSAVPADRTPKGRSTRVHCTGQNFPHRLLRCWAGKRQMYAHKLPPRTAGNQGVPVKKEKGTGRRGMGEGV